MDDPPICYEGYITSYILGMIDLQKNIICFCARAARPGKKLKKCYHYGLCAMPKINKIK